MFFIGEDEQSQPSNKLILSLNKLKSTTEPAEKEVGVIKVAVEVIDGDDREDGAKDAIEASRGSRSTRDSISPIRIP